MAERVVVDASVALASLLEERSTRAARAAFAHWAEAGDNLLVPSHFWIEVAHVLGRRRQYGPVDLVEQLLGLDGLGMATVELDRPLLLLAIDQMVRSGLSAYDAIYLALALSTNSRLATLDRRLADAAGDSGMLIGSSGVSEPKAAYQPDRPDYSGWAHTAVVGAHIAELRREALGETG